MTRTEMIEHGKKNLARFKPVKWVCGRVDCCCEKCCTYKQLTEKTPPKYCPNSGFAIGMWRKVTPKKKTKKKAGK